MLKNLEKAIESKSINKSKCIILANYKNSKNDVEDRKKGKKEFASKNSPRKASTYIREANTISLIDKLSGNSVTSNRCHFSNNNLERNQRNNSLPSMLKPQNHRSNDKSTIELREKNFEYLKVKANQYDVKVELFDFSRLIVSFKEDNNTGFSSNFPEFETYLTQIFLS